MLFSSRALKTEGKGMWRRARSSRAGAAPGARTHAARREQEGASGQEHHKLVKAVKLIGLVSGGLIEVALPTLVHGPLQGSASDYGFILAGWGAGALVGAILAGALGKRQHKGVILLLAGLLMATLIALLPIWGVRGAIVCMLLAGVAGSIVNVVLFTALQLAIPSHLMGRVMGLLLFSSFGVYPLSVALAGALADQVGPALFFPFSGLLLAVAMLFGMTQRALRDI